MSGMVRELFDFLLGAGEAPAPIAGMEGTMFNDSKKAAKAEAAEPLFSADGAERRRASAWIDAQLRRAKKERFYVIDHMTTPALAEALLEMNTNNRRLRNPHVMRITTAISDGRFLATPCPVIVFADGLLGDGQHRLNGIVEAGKPAPISYAFGWPREIFKVLDTGVKRTGGDVLGQEGEEWSDQLAAGLRKLAIVTSDQPRGNAPLDNDQIIEMLAENPAMRQSCPIGHRVYRTLKTPPTAIVVAHYLITRRRDNAQRAEIFFETLASGLGLASKRDPIYVLRAFLLEGRAKGKAGTASTPITASTIKAFNEYKAGRKTSLKKIEWLKDEPFPAVE